MALKYQLEFVDRLDGAWLIEIDSPNYTGDPIQLQGGDNPLTIDYSGNSDDDIFKSHVVSSSITINAINTGIDLDEIFYINDASLKTRVYYESVLKWQGYLISDGVQEIDSGVPYEVTLKAIDGLDLLSNVIYNLSNYPAVVVNSESSELRSPINSIRSALFSSQNLDNRLPIRWNTSLKNDHYPTRDMIAGATKLNPFGDLKPATRGLGETVSWWIDNISKSALSWLYQKNGYWYLTNYFDVLSNDGAFNGFEITSDTTNTQTAALYDGLEITEILASDTVNENWFWFGKKPFGKVNVLYNDTKFPNNNVIPNGGFDITSLGAASYWNTVNSRASLSVDDPINGRTEGNSLRVWNPTIFEDYVTTGQIPIDTKTLFRTAQWGFLWAPVSGYELDVNGDIDFSKNPLNVSVKYTIGGNTYYLNEFGFWSDTNVPANAQVTSATWSSFSGGTYTVQFNQDKIFLPGDEFRVFYTSGGVDQAHGVTFTETMTVKDGIDYIASLIPNSSRVNDWTLDIINVTNNPSYQTAFTQKVFDYYRRIEFDFGKGYKLNDVINIQFVTRGSSGDVKLPEGMGFLSFDIYSKEESEMRLDDVFFSVQDNHDIYTVGISSSKNSEESYEMGISSGFSGNMVSSYGDRYDLVNQSAYWNGGKTLTELYGTHVMDVRNKPCRVFSGDIDKMVDWGLFTLMGRTYAPLSMSLNCRDLITNVTGCEFNPNNAGYYVEHKSSGY